MIYVNEFYDSEEPNNIDYIETCLTKHDCQKMIQECIDIWEEIVYGDKDIEDIETENTTIKEELAYFMGKQSADDSYDFRDYYETSFGFAFAVLDRADEIIRNVEFKSYKY